MEQLDPGPVVRHPCMKLTSRSQKSTATASLALGVFQGPGAMRSYIDARFGSPVR